MTYGALLKIVKAHYPDDVVNINNLIETLGIKILEDENRILRRHLWINHGCEAHCLYGDDGEMQCGSCLIDFKRWDVKRIMKSIEAAALLKLNRGKE